MIKSYIAGNINKLLLLLAILCAGPASMAQVSALTVISNAKGTPETLRFSELKSIFMGEQQRWRNGTKITLALMKTNTDVGKVTSFKVYGMSGDELNKFWLALVFQGKAAAPIFFNSVSELENFVAHNPGAIGITDQLAANTDIKTIMVEGRKIL